MAMLPGNPQRSTTSHAKLSAQTGVVEVRRPMQRIVEAESTAAIDDAIPAPGVNSTAARVTASVLPPGTIWIGLHICVLESPYRCCTCPLPVPLMLELAQYCPVWPSMSPIARRTGILAPSAAEGAMSGWPTDAIGRVLTQSLCWFPYELSRCSWASVQSKGFCLSASPVPCRSRPICTEDKPSPSALPLSSGPAHPGQHALMATPVFSRASTLVMPVTHALDTLYALPGPEKPACFSRPSATEA